jgi:hypothetical protein
MNAGEVVMRHVVEKNQTWLVGTLEIEQIGQAGSCSMRSR